MNSMIKKEIYFFKCFCIFLSTLFIFSKNVSASSFTSPNKVLEVKFYLDEEGHPYYDFKAEGFEIIKKAKLGFKLYRRASLDSGFLIDTVFYDEVNQNWAPVWGEERNIKDHYKSMTVVLRKNNSGLNRLLHIEFRLYNEGLGFRYLFPKNGNHGFFIVTDELTEFNFEEDLECWWIPGDYDSNEYPYTQSKLSQINALSIGDQTKLDFRHLINDSLIQTPTLMRNSHGAFMALHEAALRHYPAMHLQIDRVKSKIHSRLVPNSLGHCAYLQDGDKTPWRVILYARQAKELLTNRVILNLNEPSIIPNSDFIKPGKYIGVWWEMHIGKSSWNYWNSTDFTPIPNHGANTKNVLRHIDFAAKHGFPYVLVEGWNRGWEEWYGVWKESIFSFTEPYPDLDLKLLSDYAKSKNVQLIMHHETSGAVTDYERKLDSAIALMKLFGYPGIKGGYVGKIIPRGEHHDGQWMVEHYERLAQKMAQNKLTLDLHESVRPTGLHRTYPNWWTNEAARGNEFNAWSKGNPPEHETILPFTRLLGGPMDYTPGIFQIKMNVYDSARKEQVHTTIAKQLALYITMYSPLQMAADLIENYEKQTDLFQFIKDVPTDWDSTVVLDAFPGDFIYMARKTKGSEHWFFGAITDENEKILEFEPSFLIPDSKYNITIYRDGDDAHWESNPMSYKIEKKTIRSKEKIKIKLAPGGGCAIHFAPVAQKRKGK